jgi:alpha-ketoglutarate-dependent taurine dioxygenase
MYKANLPLPLIVQAANKTDVVSLNAIVKEVMESDLTNAGALLFRGFDLKADDFEVFISSITSGLLEYDYASTPRTLVKGHVYTSTEYPAELKIPMHNEMAYSSSWPKILWLYCETAAKSGGETPLADSRKVFRRIPPQVRQRFIDNGVLYTRTYNTGLDVPWQQVFGSDDRRVVEAYCERAGISFEWLDDDVLKTRQVCQAVTQHPLTGDMVWFNQAHLFHVSGLRPDVRENLLLAVDEENLPRNAYFGDGSPIEGQVLDEIRAIYDEVTVAFPWQQGDLLLVDNLLAAHARNSFTGDRRILVAMA